MSELKITQQALENRQTRLTVEVPQPRVDAALRKKVKSLSRRIRIPGFRPGKAPYHIVVQRLGREALLQEVAEEIGEEVYQEALETAGIEPVGPGNLVDIAFDPLTYQFEVPLEPNVDPGDYRSVRVSYEEPDEASIDEDVDKEIERIREANRNWTPVERPVEYGDLVTLKIEVTVDDEVVLQNDDWDVVPDKEDYTLTPEFDAALVGMEGGEEKTFTAVFPEDAHSPWAGKEGVFHIEIKDVQTLVTPEFDDEFAAAIGGYDTAEDMREAIREHLAQHARENAEAAFREKVIEALIEQAEMDYPPIMIERLIDDMMRELERTIAPYGIESVAEYLRMVGKTEEEQRAELRSDAEKRLRYELLLNAIAEREAFPVSDYEIDQVLLERFGASDEVLEQVRKQVAEDEAVREYFEHIVKRLKAQDLILAIARGEEVPAPGEHVAKQPPDALEAEDETLEDENLDQDVETGESAQESHGEENGSAIDADDAAEASANDEEETDQADASASA
ncbi:MAG: trigger factor [Chloroflexi bacterium]|nr:trigger factor [Chloroflexota bacterium]